MMKSNPVTTEWAMHKMKNSSTKEVLPLLHRLRAPHNGSHPGLLAKGLEIPRESDLSPTRLDHKTYTGVGETDSSLGGHKQNLVRTKIQRKGAVTLQETKPKLQDSVGGLLWRPGSAEAHHRPGGTGSSGLGRSPVA